MVDNAGTAAYGLEWEPHFLGTRVPGNLAAGPTVRVLGTAVARPQSSCRGVFQSNRPFRLASSTEVAHTTSEAGQTAAGEALPRQPLTIYVNATGTADPECGNRRDLAGRTSTRAVRPSSLAIMIRFSKTRPGVLV
jgi:hypothetical protein